MRHFHLKLGLLPIPTSLLSSSWRRAAVRLFAIGDLRLWPEFVPMSLCPRFLIWRWEFYCHNESFFFQLGFQFLRECYLFHLTLFHINEHSCRICESEREILCCTYWLSYASSPIISFAQPSALRFNIKYLHIWLQERWSMLIYLSNFSPFFLLTVSVWWCYVNIVLPQIVIDVRNTYETRIGKFKGAVDPRTSAFREFPAWVDDQFQLEESNDQDSEQQPDGIDSADEQSGHRSPKRLPRVAMYCTGGIRCEKASSFLLSKGFKEVCGVVFFFPILLFLKIDFGT